MPIRFTAAVSAVALAFLVLSVAAFVTEARQVGALRAELRAFENEGEALDDVRRRQDREEEVINQIAGRLGDGKVTLRAAVDQTEPLLRDRSGFMHEWRDDPPPTYRHRVARYLIGRVAFLLDREPDRLATVLPGLRAEYDTLR